eukprot:gene5264-17585_t
MKDKMNERYAHAKTTTTTKVDNRWHRRGQLSNLRCSSRLFGSVIASTNHAETHCNHPSRSCFLAKKKKLIAVVHAKAEDGMADMMGDMMGDMTDMLGGANLDLLQAGLQAARAAATAQGCSRRDRRMFSDMLGGLDDMMDGVDEMMGGLASGFGAMGMDITSMMEDNNAPDCGTLLAAVAASESAVQAAGGTIGDASGASAVTATMAGVVVVVAAMLF